MSDPAATDSDDSGPGPVRGFLAAVGRPVVEVGETLVDIGRTFMLTLYYLFNGRRRWRAVLDQM
ncbi:MAG: hypothetical protein ABEN55_21780, partial [Bradymonadaceae bacterium]